VEELQKSRVYVIFCPTIVVVTFAVFVSVSAAATISTHVLHKIVVISFGYGDDVEPVPFVHEMSAKLQ
jgi:hypothetical protein